MHFHCTSNIFYCFGVPGYSQLLWIASPAKPRFLNVGRFGLEPFTLYFIEFCQIFWSLLRPELQKVSDG